MTYTARDGLGGPTPPPDGYWDGFAELNLPGVLDPPAPPVDPTAPVTDLPPTGWESVWDGAVANWNRVTEQVNEVGRMLLDATEEANRGRLPYR